jgi:hypothetical protein
MRHLTEGELMAYLDDELDARMQEWIQAHLSNCVKCRVKADKVKTRGAYVRTRLHSLETVSVPFHAETAQRRWEQQLKSAGVRKRTSIFNTRSRLAWTAVTLVLAITLLLSLAPLRAFANDFLALFRVQKLEFVEFNPLNLPNSEASLRTAAMEVDKLLDEEVELVLHGEPQVVTQSAARDMTDFTVRFPAMQDLVTRITLQPRFEMVLQLDLAEIRTLFAAVGYSGVSLPQTLDGAVIQAVFDNAVVTAMGQCADDPSGPSASGDCTIFIQTPSPGVTAPSELDLHQLGQLYLQMLGMKSSQAERFSRNIDWTTTLVVPIPSTEATFEDVVVDGVPGTIITGQRHHEVVLMWVKNDILYAVVGVGEADTLLDIADSLE